MKFKLPAILFWCFLSLHCGAQRYYYSDYYNNPVTYEAGFSIGPMNSLTDIGGRNGKGKTGPKDLNIKSTDLYGSVFASAIYKHFLALRIEGTIGRVKSKDSLLKSVKVNRGAIGRYSRNLSFRSPIEEISLTAEFHPIDFFSNFNPERFPPVLSPYFIGGVGYFHFNPQANLDGKWINLRPLHTEGEGFAEYPGSKEYKLNQFNIPLGFGIAYEASPKFNIRIEYITRKLFTDYLDDVHDKYIDPALFNKYLSGIDLANAQILNNRVRPDALPNDNTARPGGRRGNPLNNDSYFTINFKIAYVFGRDESSSPFGGGSGGSGGKMSDRKFRQMQKHQRSCPRLF